MQLQNEYDTWVPSLENWDDGFVAVMVNGLAHLTHVNIDFQEDCRAVLSTELLKCWCNLLAWYTPTKIKIDFLSSSRIQCT